MKYVLVEDKQYVILGPMEWRPRMFQTEIDELDIPWQVPPVEQGYISITDRYEIYPVVNLVQPNYNPDFEELVGPTYSFVNNEAVASFAVANLPIEQIKNILKNKVSAERYFKEIAGTKVTLNGVDYPVETDRESRTKWIQLASLPGPTNWKIAGTFINLSQQDANTILQAVVDYVQAQFDWEMNMYSLIDSKTRIDDLKTIEIPKTMLIRNNI